MREQKSDNKKVFLLVSLLFLYLVAGPLLYALIYPLLSKDPLISYASLFIPSLLTFSLILTIWGKEVREDLEWGRKFSLPLFFIFLLSSLLILSLLSMFSSASLYPHRLKLKLLSALISLTLLPIQTGIEEYIFRVIPISFVKDKSILNKKGYALTLSIASGLLFTLPHLANREVWVDGGYWAVIHYFLWGFLAMGSSIITKGFELPFALHLSNNLSLAVVANYKGSSLSSIPFFILENETSSMEAIAVFVSLFAFELLLFYLLNRRKNK